MAQSQNVLKFGYVHNILGLRLHTLKVAEAVHIADNWCSGGLK